MSIAAHHAEWLSLADTAGPFLSVAVLSEALPNGLDSHDPHLAAELRAAHDAWADPAAAGFESRAVLDLHRAFVRFVLHRVLAFDRSCVREDEETLRRFTAASSTHEGVKLAPDWVVLDGDQPLMLVTVLDSFEEPDRPTSDDGWIATPQERMVEHLAAVGCSLGLVTNGERWRLVSVRPNRAPGFATWLASMWREERITLQSFRTLLGSYRFFSVPEEETLVGLLDRSVQDQSEITTKLGNQTLEAVEILIRTIDRLDGDRGGSLLADVPESELYDAAVTVMMRLIFLFFAEENDLLPMEEPLYVEQYAASSLRARLQEEADRSGEEVLETTADAWPRLLATWRAVSAGVEHGDMRLAPYGGSLFDPDRYPFLEGRLPGTSWRMVSADSLPIDNRTVLHLLNALQTIRERGQRHRISFRALDVEQIGHVYEGMLDHTAIRATGWVLGLSGVGGNEPEVSLDDLDRLDQEGLVEYLAECTGRTKQVVADWLSTDSDRNADVQFAGAWGLAFAGDVAVAQRSRHFAKFIRSDSTGAPTVFRPGSVYVGDSSHRGATGTHYTPRAFTAEIVAETLEPLVYDGASDGLSREDWVLRAPDTILALRICDPACGSGAFLVQACRYLGDKLAEARYNVFDIEQPINVIEGRREVAEHCLFGVDVNPMAVEMTKLSLWLITLSKDRPFTFLDHAIKRGDTLLGVTNSAQLEGFSMNGDRGSSRDRRLQVLLGQEVQHRLASSVLIHSRIARLPSTFIADIEVKSTLHTRSALELESLKHIADRLCAVALASTQCRPSEEEELWLESAADISRFLHGKAPPKDFAWQTRQLLDSTGIDLTRMSSFFHWPLEFPHVFGGPRGGFDAVLGNPPFLGGQRLSGHYGTPYREYLLRFIGRGKRGSADLVAYFFLRAAQIAGADAFITLLGTNSVAQGNTREVGLDQLVGDGWEIVKARRSEIWPGQANVRVARVGLARSWSGAYELDGATVPRITTSLAPGGRVIGTPYRLIMNRDRSFQGGIIHGSGFVLNDSEAQDLIASDSRNRNVVLPYINGKDVNTNPDQRASRWVINFFDWDEEEARTYEDAFHILEERVKPHRQERSANNSFKHGAAAARRWWNHYRTCPALYHAIGRGHSFRHHPPGWDPSIPPNLRALVVAQVSSTLAFAFVENDQVFDAKLVVFTFTGDAHFGVLSSSLHALWCWRYGTTMKADLTYGPSKVFETFPWPAVNPSIEVAGGKFELYRRDLMLRRGEGLTATYKRLHNPHDDSEDIRTLRFHLAALDDAVCAAYGWSDLDLAHDFFETDRGIQFTIAPEAATEVLDRLLELNHAKYAEEVQRGLHDGADDQPDLLEAI